MKILPLALLLGIGVSTLSLAETISVTKPDISIYNNGYIIIGISPNGKYTLYENRSEEETNGGRIVNRETNEESFIIAKNDSAVENGSCADISDDGNIVVGVYEDSPAYWNKSTGKWTQLSINSFALSGEAVGITGDGKYAVGREFYAEYPFGPKLWDITTGDTISLKNLPHKDLSGAYQGQNQFQNISSDGRFILGVLSYSYPNDMLYYVYDRTTETPHYIGFTYANNKFTAQASGLLHIDAAAMSPNGYYVTGKAYMSDESVCAFSYNCLTDEFTIFDTENDSGIVGIGIDDNGNVYGATPADDPVRDMYIRSGNYWYSMENILSQRYGINFSDRTGLDCTGTPVAVSGDGRFIGAFSNPEEGSGCNYTFNEDVQTACASVNLMGNYSVNPVSGSNFSAISQVKISFDREVKLLGDANSAQLLDSDSTLVKKSMGISVDGSAVTITFRPTTLAEGKTYRVLIPAGVFSMKNDENVKSQDIDITYIGRSNTPVSVSTIYPSRGTAVSKFDYSSSHIIAYFDASINVVDGAKALVYRNDETDAYEEMALYSKGNVLTIYPSSTLYLFKDNTYKVVIPAGSLTDAGGSGKNEEIVINYSGNYEREVSSTDKCLFSEDFSEGLGNQFMYYEGDKNTPNEEMQGYGFTATTTPWWVAKDATTVDPSGNYAAMSTSAYSPAGRSDDWMVTPSLYIPDANCYLSFKTQGFRNAAQDTLSVYVIPSSKVYNTLSEAAMTELKANKITVFKDVVSPGSSEENLINDWQIKEIPLNDYAGKDIYIAFVNENNNQSIVFVDDVEVIHEMNYLVALDNETTVVNKDKVDIFGRVVVQTETSKYTKAHLELLDSKGNLVDSIDDTDVSIDKDHSYSFKFSKPLPVKVGEEVDFQLVVALGDDHYTISRTITDLAFEPTKRVFLEEYAGAGCKNCPLGILAMEKLEKELPNNFIGITIRTYDNDELSSNLGSYSSFLGFTAAPTAMINRKVIAAPMTQLNGKYVFSNPDSELWSDIVYSELNTPAIADISISAQMDDNYIYVPVTVKYALNKTDVNANIFMVVVEDKIKTYQLNTFYTTNDENLGEWGAGGVYASATVRKYYINDIARAAVGSSFNGSIGYVPSTVVADVENVANIKFGIPETVSNWNNARLVAVLIDNNTDEVINACQCTISTSGVADVATDSANVYADNNGSIVVESDSLANVSVYNLAGNLIATADGEGTMLLDTNGYSGVVIVRVTTDNNSIVKKLIVK